PDAEDASMVASAAAVVNTMLCVNAPSLLQHAVARLQGITVDVSIYRRRRDLLCRGLSEIGYEFHVPEGAFYLFPKSPIADDVKFTQVLKEELILAVPGVGFAGPGYFRLSYAIPDSVIAGSMAGFKRALEKI
ncbi:MAG: aminotransferase class I/II-fold pyridoxal phosphate-dependent enzyme, partial [Desulfobacterales bacterium]